MVLCKAHRIAVVRLDRDASTQPPSRFAPRQPRIFAPMVMGPSAEGPTGRSYRAT